MEKDKKNFFENNTNLLTILLIIILIIELLLTILYSYKVFTTKSFNSDFAGDAIFAKTLAEEGKMIFSENWYPTTELYVIHHQLIMTPLFYIFDNYIIVNTISTGIAFVLLLFTFYYFLRVINCSRIRSLFILALILSPINYFLHTFLVLFQGYLFFVILQVLYLSLLLKILNNRNNKTTIILFYLVSFCIGLCGIRLFIVFYIPLIILLVLKDLDWKPNKMILKNKKVLIILLSFLLSIIAYIIYKNYLSIKYSFTENILTAGLDNLSINNNFSQIIASFLDSIGFNIDSLDINCLLFKIQILKLFIWIYALVKNIHLAFFKKEKNTIEFIAKFNILCIIVTLVSMILTCKTFVQSSRYLGLSCFLIMPIAFVNLDKPNLKLKSLLIYSFTIITVYLGSMYYFYEIIHSESISNNREQYLEYLDSNNYKFGIATYWNANITTFLSKNNVEVMPIISPNNLEILKWNTKKSFEKLTPEFLILSLNEWKSIENEKFKKNIVYKDDYYIIIDCHSTEW